MSSHKARQVEDENIELVKSLSKKLDKGVSFEKTMHILHKLQKIPITIRLFEETKIGYKIRALSKKEKDNDIGKTAKLLTLAWKRYVRNQRDSDNERNPSEEEEEVRIKQEEDDEEEESPSKRKHHHKKKKKKSSKEDLHSDDEMRREKKRDKKRKQREEEEEEEEEERQHHSSVNNRESKSSTANGAPKLKLADDIFGSALGMSDNVKPSPRKQPAVINSDSSQVRFEPRKKALPSANGESSMHQHNAHRTMSVQSNHSLAGMKMKGRTAVYAGTSRGAVPKVYRLVDICLKVLMEHIDQIYEVGDVPFHLLKKVLSKCDVKQLERIEYYNPQIREDSDVLWKDFVEKEFRDSHPRSVESWRDYYSYLVQEREEKLKKITQNINSKQRKATPERTTQQLLDVRTPREIRRRQERLANGGGGWAGPSSSRTGSKTITSVGGQVTIVSNKPKTAPLMKKLIKLRTGKGSIFRR